MNTRAYNFNAGPAALPLEVLQTAAVEMTDYAGTGMSVMELSHRSASYEAIHNEVQQRFRALYQLPATYRVLLLQGGASTQFAMVPLNMVQPHQQASYIVNGSWGIKAHAEAALLGEAVVCASSKEGGYRSIPALDVATLSPDTAYVHLTTNETIEGVQCHTFPTIPYPLVADMSSDILSRPVDLTRFALVYAGAQKNLGPSGVTVVIAHEDVVERSPATVPTMLRYDTHAKNNSLYNTPPTYSIYMMNLVLRWVEQRGGLKAIAQGNEQKAQLLYNVIDESAGFYVGHAEKSARSRMNVTFRLADRTKESVFLEQAQQHGFIGLTGHRSVGGCRASTYNAVPYEACAALATFMRDFLRRS